MQITYNGPMVDEECHCDNMCPFCGRRKKGNRYKPMWFAKKVICERC